MPKTPQSQVLIAGAGPIGLTAANELTRRGIDCRIVDPLPEPPQYAKAVGVQPRTLEVFEAMGVLPVICDAESQFAAAYATGGRTTFVVRPDGYLGFAGGEEVEAMVVTCAATFG